MDYVCLRLDQKGPDNNLCAKRVCLGKSVTLHFSSQDARANLPSRRGLQVSSSHKKRIWCDDGKKGKKKKEEKEEKEETQPRADWTRACEKKKKS